MYLYSYAVGILYQTSHWDEDFHSHPPCTPFYPHVCQHDCLMSLSWGESELPLTLLTEIYEDKPPVWNGGRTLWWMRSMERSSGRRTRQNKWAILFSYLGLHFRWLHLYIAPYIQKRQTRDFVFRNLLHNLSYLAQPGFPYCDSLWMSLCFSPPAWLHWFHFVRICTRLLLWGIW